MIIPHSNTKLFLARVMAWPQEGEAPAFVNIHNTFVPSDMSKVKTNPKNGRPHLPWFGLAFKSLDSAVNYVGKCNTTLSTKDIYFCTSTQALAKQSTSAKGHIYQKALRSSEGAVRIKSLFIDSDLIDGKNEEDKDKGYESKGAFGKALVEFLKATGLPKPTIIVGSGGGFHMYWTMARALSVQE